MTRWLRDDARERARMRFVGGSNRRGSKFFRYVPNTLSTLEIDEGYARLRVGSRFVQIFDGPFVWSAVDLEFTRQPVARRSYVGLRAHGDADWILFRTRALEAVCCALTTVGATEVTVAPVTPSEVLFITPYGVGLTAVIGAVLLVLARLATLKHDSMSQMFAMDFQVAGLIALALSFVTGLVHVIERR